MGKKNYAESYTRGYWLLTVNSRWCLPSTWQEEYANVLAKLFRKSNCQQEDVMALFISTCQNLKGCEHHIDAVEALHLPN